MVWYFLAETEDVRLTGGIFAILDDIAVLLDDAAVMSKVAAKKTAGILGDDLAVNAEKATGFHASRELPVLWAITKGSFLNKVIILPLAFLLSAFAPWLIVPVLLAGGAYLSFEGVEKVYHVLFQRKSKSPEVENITSESEQLRIEKEKIRSAIRTDFILSIEIIIIALGTVLGRSLPLQIMVVSMIAMVATVGVYGLVALLVRMDDAGFFLITKAQVKKGMTASVIMWSGNFLVSSLPHAIRLLGIIGTVAMLVVGGGMFTHNIASLHHLVDFMPSLLGDLTAGTVLGILLLAVQQAVVKAKGRWGD